MAPDPSSSGGIDAHEFQRAQAAVVASIIQATERAIDKYGMPSTDAERAQFARRLMPDMMRARSASYRAAVAHMRHAAEYAGVTMPEPAKIAGYGPQVLARIIKEATAPETPADPTAMDQVTEAARKRPDPGQRLSAKLAQQAQGAGRAVVKATAESAGEQVAWARVLAGAEQCAFCVRLAARGPVYRTDETAQRRGKRQTEDKYHDHCACTPTLAFKGRDWDGREQHKLCKALWVESARDEQGERAQLNVLRRHLARADREGWSHQELLDKLRDGTAGGADARSNRAYTDRVTTTPAEFAKTKSRAEALIDSALPANVRRPKATSIELFERDRNGVAAEVSTKRGSTTFRPSSEAQPGDPIGVVTINPTMQGQELTVVHELGHVFDVQLEKEHRAGQAAALNAIRESATIKKLEAHPTDGAKDVHHKDYLLRGDEVFARAFAQYVAVRSGNPKANNTVSFHRGGDGLDQFQQWPDDEFDKVVLPALDEFFHGL